MRLRSCPLRVGGPLGGLLLTCACGSAVTSASTNTTTGHDESTTVSSQGSDTTTIDPPGTSGPVTTTAASSSDDGETGKQDFLFDVGGGMATGTTDGTTGPLPLDYDCDALVQPFVSEMLIPNARGYHDVYFDDAGHIIGYDYNSLVQVTYDGQVSVFLPGVEGVQGMDLLANGDLLYVNNSGELRRVTPELDVSVVGTGLYGGYGVTVGPDQLAYACHYDGVMRIDPDTGESEPYITLPGGTTPRAIVFDLDSTGVYMSTLLAPSSPVYFQAVDDDLDPVDEPVIFATGVGQGYHDGLGIDACGNLYVPDYSTSGLYRVDPEGTVTVLYSGGGPGQSHYGHGLEWGSGIGGWQDHAIYLPLPYNGLTVNEVVLGVPSGSTVRTWR